MAESAIQWTDYTWNCVVGCSICSPGCKNCYAMTMARRIVAMAKALGRVTHYARTITTHLVKGKHVPVWTGKLEAAPEHIWLAPLRLKKPRKIFVNSMSDCFHEDMPAEWLDRMFAIMALADWHVFQVLTKRSEIMRAYINSAPVGRIMAAMHAITGEFVEPIDWPLKNVWLGVSVEDQRRADARIPDLCATAAAIRFLSMEPLLEAVDISEWVWNFQGCKDCPGADHPECCHDPELLPSLLHWVILGGESGRGARELQIGWIRDVLYNGKGSGVAFYVKQLGADPVEMKGERLRMLLDLKDKSGGDPDEWPEDLRVRDFPRMAA